MSTHQADRNLAIVAMRAEGATHAAIAEAFGISLPRVGQVLKSERYRIVRGSWQSKSLIRNLEALRAIASCEKELHP